MEQSDTVISLVPGRLALRLYWRGHLVDSLEFAIRSSLPTLERRWIAQGDFAGAFVKPAGPGPFPALLVLHGSEGGDSTTARILAEGFANHGYATFAVTYFAWQNAIPTVSSALANIPLEMLDHARDWLGAQSGVDTSRTIVWGASKGAELALMIASHRTWPKAVVACVPSDVVWTGFGREPHAGERMSSWSDGGVPFPFVPYDRYDESLQGKITARTAHDRSRVLFSDSVAPARIPVERIRAPLLLLGSDRDEVWASGDMTRSIVARRAAAGLAGTTESLTRAESGHGVCGVPSTPWKLYERSYPTDTPPSARATAEAGAENWQLTLDFLRRRLSRPK